MLTEKLEKWLLSLKNQTFEFDFEDLYAPTTAILLPEGIGMQLLKENDVKLDPSDNPDVWLCATIDDAEVIITINDGIDGDPLEWESLFDPDSLEEIMDDLRESIYADYVSEKKMFLEDQEKEEEYVDFDPENEEE